MFWLLNGLSEVRLATEMTLSRHLNDSTNSLENENDTEIGMNALELLDEETKSDSLDSMFIIGSPPVSKGDFIFFNFNF